MRKSNGKEHKENTNSGTSIDARREKEKEKLKHFHAMNSTQKKQG